jgi:arginine repressor
LPAALEFYVAIHIYKGAFSAAESLLAEEDALAQATGIIAGSDVALLLAAWKEPAAGSPSDSHCVGRRQGAW